MTEHTDKSAPKSGKTPPRKRGGKSRAPGGKRATAPGDTPAAAQGLPNDLPKNDRSASDASSSGGTKAAVPAGAAAKSLAPDPATITFGSNRPIVAAPPKLPESSGLHFSGSSAGELKASGPQPTSPKASGLTFTAAKSAPAKPTPPKSPSAKPTASAAKPPAAGSGAIGKDPAKKPEPAKTDPQKAEAAKADAKKAALTKPAIAPQASGRRFDRERSTGGFVMIMLVLTVLGGSLAFWMKIDNEAAMPPQVTADATAPDAAAPESATPEAAASETPSTAEPVVAFGPSVRAPESPGPLVAGDRLSPAEIDEIQRLLVRLDFDPGSRAGVLTAETAAAIRSYQEMAGLPADGEADKALLDELRSVAELYGS